MAQKTKAEREQARVNKQIEAQFRAFSQRFQSYVEAAYFNLLASGSEKDNSCSHLMATAVNHAEHLMEHLGEETKKAFERRIEKVMAGAETEPAKEAAEQ